MRSVSPTIANAERGPVQMPVHKLKLVNELLGFGVATSTAYGTLDANVPVNAIISQAGTCYVTFRNASSGGLHVRSINPTTPGDWALASSGAVALTGSVAMRAGLVNDGATCYVYDVIDTGTALQLRRSTLSGATPTLAWSNVGTPFAAAFSATGVIRRVEAVIANGTAGALVAVGEHDTATEWSTVTFWYVPASGSAYQLQNLVQFPFVFTDTSWYQESYVSTRVCGAFLADGGAVVIAPDTALGRAICFTFRNGVESLPLDVVPCDRQNTAIVFAPANATVINGLCYLSGRITRKPPQNENKDPTNTTAYDCVLVGTGDGIWSVGERDRHYICGADAKGVLLLTADGNTVVYGGHGVQAQAPATPVQNPALTLQTQVVDSRLLRWQLQETTNAADQLQAELDNSDGGLDSGPAIRSGAFAHLESGQVSEYTAIGVYGVDDLPRGVGVSGRDTVKVTARDKANKALIDWRAPLTGQLMARTSLRSAMTKTDSLRRLTPDRGHKHVASGLKFTGLNEPYLAFANGYDHGNGQTDVIVRCEVTDAYHLSSVGVVVGATEEGDGHVLLIPKANALSWAFTSPRLRRLALPAADALDPDAEDTGFNLGERTRTLAAAQDPATLITAAAVGGSVRVNTGYSVPVASDQYLTVRVAGRRVQVFAKTRDLAPATVAANAWRALAYEYQFDYRDIKRKGAATASGLAISTDVFVNRDAFAQAFYSDGDLGLSDARNDGIYGVGHYTTPITGLITEPEPSPGAPSNVIEGSGTLFTTQLRPGQMIRIASHFRVIQSITSNTLMVMTDYYGPFARQVNGPAHIRTGAYFASASSRQKTTTQTISGQTVVVPRVSKAPKRAIQLAGRALFISNDNTAFDVADVVSDGVDHRLIDAGWGGTNPIPEGVTGYSGSDPGQWRCLFYRGRIAVATAASLGLPVGGRMIIDDEVIRYAERTIQVFRENLSASAWQNYETWLEVPTGYAVPVTQAVAGPSISAYNPGAGHLKDPAFTSMQIGDLIEISSRDSDSQGYFVAGEGEGGSPKQKYVLAIAGANDLTTGEYSEALGVLGSGHFENALTKDDVVVISGRGQFGTTKKSHDASAPVLYYPCDASGAPASVTIKRYGHWSGRLRTLQDAVDATAKIAGVRSCGFRNAYAAATSAPATLGFGSSGTAQALNLRENVADFVLDLTAHIPGNSTNALGAGGIINAKALVIGFRSYYRLHIQQYSRAEDYAGGHHGNIRIGLATTDASVTPAADGVKWLDGITVPLSYAGVAGAVTGSSPNFTLTEDTAKTNRIRVAALGSEVIVEIDGQPAVTFDLEALRDGGNDYARFSAGPVTIEYTAAMAGNVVTAWAQELHAEVSDIVINKGASARSVIDELIDGRHVRTRATAGGGMDVSQWWVREVVGVGANLFSDTWRDDDNLQFGHLEVVGQSAGERLDDAQTRGDGYRFASETNEHVATADAAEGDARLRLRENIEFAEQRGVTAGPFVEVQPEDTVTLGYGASAAQPALASQDFVVTGLTTTATAGSVQTDMTLRKAVAP